MPKSPVTQRLPELAESKSLLETLNEEVAKTRKTLARTRIFRLATVFSRLLWEPQLQKAIFDGTVKTVVVWKLDRLSRRASTKGSVSWQPGVTKGCESFLSPSKSTSMEPLDACWPV